MKSLNNILSCICKAAQRKKCVVYQKEQT